MNDFYTIGEVSKMTGVTKDTLHFYDKIGLFKPERLNSENGYRYYSYQQFWLLDIITCCRSLDIPIDTIRNLILAKDNRAIVALLRQHREYAEQKRDTFQRIMEDIDWYCMEDEKINSCSETPGILIRDFPEETVLFGENAQLEAAYHPKLQALYSSQKTKSAGIRRNYGYVLQVGAARNNLFHKTGEYVRLETGQFTGLPDSHSLIIPAGRYLCAPIQVSGEQADFKPLFSFADRHRFDIELLFADEVGMQLFYYRDYPCMIRAKVSDH